MPWCPSCDRFLTPASVATDGTCPRCGRPVDPGHARAPASPGRQAGSQADGPGDEPLDPLPWHFKLLVGAITVYLGYRAFQGIEWLVGLV